MTLEEMIAPSWGHREALLPGMRDIRGKAQFFGGVVSQDLLLDGEGVDIASQSEETHSPWARTVREGRLESWQVVWAVVRAQKGRPHRWLACLITFTQGGEWEEMYFDLTRSEDREGLNFLRSTLVD